MVDNSAVPSTTVKEKDPRAKTFWTQKRFWSLDEVMTFLNELGQDSWGAKVFHDQNKYTVLYKA